MYDGQMKKRRKRLSLDKTTVRRLTTDSLQRMQGGKHFDASADCANQGTTPDCTQNFTAACAYSNACPLN